MAKIAIEKNGEDMLEEFDPAKVLKFLKGLMFGLDGSSMDLNLIVESVSEGLPDTVTLTELYDFVAETAASRVTTHYDYGSLAGRIEAAKLQRQTKERFSDNVKYLFKCTSPNTKRSWSCISNSFFKMVMSHSDFFDKLIDPTRDFQLSYFGIKTLQKSYLISVGDTTAETPQFLFLRTAIAIHGDNLESVRETYELMSKKYFIHASPTLFNAGTNYGHLSSCFLVAMEDDSIDGIFKTLQTAASISKASGGIGIHVHNIRGRGSRIASSNGTSNGLVPMLRVYNNAARYVDQGGNKRPGAFAIYLEPWHNDIFEVLDLKKNHGKEELRARDLFYGLWIPDLFMRRVKEDGYWSLFSPNIAPGLSDVCGEEFEKLYVNFEKQNLAYKTVKAQKLWHAILTTQIETGGPYMLYKDACNFKSNQKNLGTIKSSNLCCEIVEYSSPKETAVCNLGSIALPSFIKETIDESGVKSKELNVNELHYTTKVLVKNLNKIIDITKYPVESARYSNLRNRPIAVGVQGLADLFMEFKYPFDSNESRSLNKQVFETIYHAAIETSIELAISDGAYETFEGSPASCGLFQFDLWDSKPGSLFNDWEILRERMKKHGLRNSLLVAPMPTASTSQILGFNECFEPYTSNLYTRRVLSGEYQVVNKYLMKDLMDLGLWSVAIKDQIILNNGSIQAIEGIPQELKNIYKTIWEISQRVVIDMAADRGIYIDQSQSMNIHLQNPTMAKLTSCHFYAWEKGLKTGMYYLRTQAAARAIQFTIDSETVKSSKANGGASVSEKRYMDEDQAMSGESKKKKKDETRFVAEADDSSKYNIHDTTPMSCNITDNEACDSCSG